MAETAPATIEINDAYFCQHFKEVVSTAHTPAYASEHRLTAPVCSARSARMMDGKRTTPSSEYVLRAWACLEHPPPYGHSADAHRVARAYSLTPSTAKASRLPRRASTRRASTSARSTDRRVRSSHLSSLLRRFAEIDPCSVLQRATSVTGGRSRSPGPGLPLRRREGSERKNARRTTSVKQGEHLGDEEENVV